LSYWRRLWAEAKKLTGQDREHGVRIIGSLLDMNNLMWAIRYRVYHKLSEEEVINYTLPAGYRIQDSDIRAIAAGADIASIVTRIYPEITDVNALLENPQTGLPKLEVLLKRRIMQQCLAAFVGSPFHIGIPLAFLVMSDLEVQDLIVLIEAKSSNLPEDEYRPFLLKTDFLN
jgi:vacuolar-type H+-ATPase subunit C/Vma6